MKMPDLRVLAELNQEIIDAVLFYLTGKGEYKGLSHASMVSFIKDSMWDLFCDEMEGISRDDFDRMVGKAIADCFQDYCDSINSEGLFKLAIELQAQVDSLSKEEDLTDFRKGYREACKYCVGSLKRYLFD